MRAEAQQKLKAMLTEDEGLRQFAYDDATGKKIIPGMTVKGNVTIGIGRNLTTKGISSEESTYFCNNDVDFFEKSLSSSLSFFNDLDENRQLALIDMCFNLGLHGFLNFKETITYLESKDWENAAREILNSSAAKRLVDRYQRIANIILTGEA